MLAFSPAKAGALLQSSLCAVAPGGAKRKGVTPRQSRQGDARQVRVIDFERAFAIIPPMSASRCSSSTVTSESGDRTAIGPHERIARNGGPQISASGLTFGLSFVAALCFVIAANRWFYAIAKEVNERLPKDAQVDAWMRHKMYEVLRLHAEMYPESPKRWHMWTLALCGFALMFGGFIASWFLPR